MKYSPRFERDYEFYFKNINRFNFAGIDIEKKYSIKQCSSGKSAKECFYILDSTGKIEDCSELELLYELLRCKASVNLHIKMYAESRAEGTLSKPELIEWLNNFESPDWVLNAVEKQKINILCKNEESILQSIRYYNSKLLIKKS
jgi:hypothetical protein